MISGLDRFLKWLWLANGILLLALMSYVIVLLGEEMSDDWGYEPPESAVDVMETQEVRGARAVRYSAPVTVFGSTSSLIRVRYGRAFQPVMKPGAAKGVSDTGHAFSQPLVNVIFIDAVSGRRHLLLDRPAYINEIDYPDSEHASAQTWISYEIAFEDTNHDGHLDGDDDAGLYVSDLSGEGLAQVTPDGVHVKWHSVYGEKKILVSVLDPRGVAPGVDPDAYPQKAFVYDVATGQTLAFDEFDGLVETAGKILAN